MKEEKLKKELATILTEVLQMTADVRSGQDTAEDGIKYIHNYCTSKWFDFFNQPIPVEYEGDGDIN